MPGGWIRLGLRLLPRSLQREYGEEIVVLAASSIRAARRRGALSGWHAGFRALRDLLATAARSRLGRSSAPHRPDSDSSPGNQLDMLLQDLRSAIRSLLRRPWFVLTVVGTLALGIGANTLVYSVVEAVVLNPFDLPDPDRVVAVGTEYPRLGQDLGFFEVLSGPEYDDIVTQTKTLEATAGFDMGNRQILGGDVPENVFTAFWWGDPLPVLGLQPLRGRSFNGQEIHDQKAVALISEQVWRSRFDAAEETVGSTIRIDDAPYVVIGVFPAAADVYGTQLWTPMWVDPAAMPRARRRQFNLMARVAEGRSLSDVNAELETFARRMEQEYGAEIQEYAGFRLRALTWTDALVRTMKPAAFVLMASVGFVMLLICANVGSLTLSRSAARQREIGVRAALGASRWRIVRQLLAESMLLAGLGAVAGATMANLALSWLQANLPSSPFLAPREFTLNANVLGYTVAITLLAGMLFGVAPALQATRANLHSLLGGAARGATGSRARRRMQDLFVAVEVALAVVLLAGAGLFLTSLARLQRVDLGFDPDNVLTMRLTLPWSRYEGEGIANFFEQLADQVETIPGVRSAASVAQFPPIGFTRQRFSLPDQVVKSERELPVALLTIASDDYFDTLGLPLRSGRGFNSLDQAGGQFVAVVNETFARRYLDDDPIGSRVKLGLLEDQERPWLSVVGVVGDTRNEGLRRPPAPEIYVGLRQVNGSFNQLFLVVRSNGDAHALVPAIREVVAAIDPEQPVYAIRTLREVLASGLAVEGFVSVLLSVFSMVALFLAATGIFGIVAYAVSQRVREIGVRIALGARSGDVRRTIVNQALLPVLVGSTVGLAMAVALGVVLPGFLSHLASFEPVILGTVVIALGCVAATASYLPARRASRIDPIEALRSE